MKGGVTPMVLMLPDQGRRLVFGKGMECENDRAQIADSIIRSGSMGESALMLTSSRCHDNQTCI